MYIDDCVEGLLRIMSVDYDRPLNLGSDRLVTINQLAEIICAIAGKRLLRRHLLGKPQGVRGRNSDNSRLRQVLGWEPAVPLEQGLAETYRWIQAQLAKRIPVAREVPAPRAASIAAP
jgi:nucleoside-diphosphate-sugar epimerase